MISLVQNDPKLELNIESLNENDSNYLRFQQDKPFSDDNIYMRPVGIKMARIAAQSAQKLGAESVVVNFSGQGELLNQRVDVLKRYFSQLLGQSINVEVNELNSGTIKSSAEIEVRVKLKNG